MFHHPYIASGQDILPILIIIFAVVSQIIKATKGAKPKIDEPESGGGYGSPEDDLKKFLESLSGGGAAQSTPAPPPLPPPVARPAAPPKPPPPPRTVGPPPPPTASKPVHAEKTQEDTAYEIQVETATQATEAPPPPESAWVTVNTGTHPKAAACADDHGATLDYRAALQCRDENRAALKKAIVMREILGPCVALQQPEH